MPKSKYVEDYTKDQPNPLDTYLQYYGYTRYKLTKESGIPSGSLQHLARRKVDNMEGKCFIAIGKLIDKSPGVVLEELLNTQKGVDELIGYEEAPLIDKD